MDNSFKAMQLDVLYRREIALRKAIMFNKTKTMLDEMIEKVGNNDSYNALMLKLTLDMDINSMEIAVLEEQYNAFNNFNL